MKKVKNISNKLFVIYLFLYIYILYVFVAPWYASPEARYARDNLNFLTKTLTEKNILKNEIRTDGDDFFHWPYDESMKKLYELSTDWNTAYMKHYTEKGVYKETEYCPYDTLSRIKYDSVIPEVNSIYRFMMIDMAITNPNNELSGELMDAWYHEREEGLSTVEESFKKMEQQKNACKFIVAVTSVPIFIYMLYTMIRELSLAYKSHNLYDKNLNGKKDEK